MPLFSTQAYTWRPKKRIRKRKPRRGDSIPRLRVALINISRKLKEVLPHRPSAGLRRTGARPASARAQKLTSMKKSILTLEALGARAPAELTPDFLSGLPRKLDRETAEGLRRPTRPLSALLRRAFNNSAAIRGSHPPETRVRDYVDNALTVGLEAAVLGLLNKLNYLQLLKQRRQAGRARKRVVFGFNEVRKKVEYLYADNRPRLVVVAVDVAENTLPGATNDQISAVLADCRAKAIPVCFAGSRKELGLALYGRGGQSLPRVSIVAVLSFMGQEEDMTALLQQLESARETYNSEYRGFLSAKAANVPVPTIDAPATHAETPA